MSLSNPQAKNPAIRFFQWRGGAEAFKGDDGKTRHEGGKVTWYDKEDQQEYEMDLPFSFIVLDELTTITGYSEKDQSGFWSNEIRNLQQEKLVVKTKSGTVATGLYGDISENIKAKGAKYAQSVYIAFKDESGELQIANIKMAGAALTAWIEFKKRFDISQCAVFITEEPKLEKKGTNYYFSPVFDGQNMSDATRNAAVKLDEELQRYLNTYFSRKPEADDLITEEDEIAAEEDAEENEQLADEAAEEAGKIDLPEDDDDEEAAAPAPKKKAATKKSSDDDKKINLADVPF
jgi:hypothetical protein